jgi:hypothetical protein
MFAGVFQEAASIMGVMAIDEKQASTTICLVSGLAVKILNPLNSNFTISVTFL